MAPLLQQSTQPLNYLGRVVKYKNCSWNEGVPSLQRGLGGFFKRMKIFKNHSININIFAE
jgi:hypothetical protein